jgi:hypothetical protein
MSKRDMMKFLATTIIASTISTLMILFLCACILLPRWGTDQECSARRVEDRVRVGMTLEELDYALGNPPGTSIYRGIGTLDSQKTPYYAKVCESGLGSWFVPQHDIILFLDKDKRVVGGVEKTVYGLGKELISVNLKSR